MGDRETGEQEEKGRGGGRERAVFEHLNNSFRIYRSGQ
jgi:hypothetical protein